MLAMCAIGLTACGHEHSYTTKTTAPTCEEQGYTTHTCSCGDSYVDNHIDEIGHIFTNYDYNNDATCLNNGSETAICDRQDCNVTDTREVKDSSLGHNFGDVEYVWQGQQCTATRICSNNANHIETQTVTGNYVEDTAASCTTSSKGHYEATFTNNAFTKQQTKTNSITMGNTLDHSFKNHQCSVCSRTVQETAITSFSVSETNNIVAYLVQTSNYYYDVYLIGSGEMRNETSSSSPLSKNNYASRVKNIIIDERIENIGSYAFYGCTNVSSITIPENIEEIGNEAFKNCSSLTNIVIPKSVVRIGANAFSGCSSMQEMTIPFVGASAYATGTNNTTMFGYIFGTDYFPNSSESLQSAGNGKYYYLPWSLKTVNVTGGSVFDWAFRSCQFSKITLTNDVTSIGSNAFFNCPWLESFIIPEGITSIEPFTFDGCYNLKSIIIPNSVETIGASAFRSCGDLQNLVIPEGVKTIDYKAFEFCDGITNIVLPNSLIELSEYAFDGCDSIENVSAPAFALSCIPKGNLKNVIITSGTSIPAGAFSGGQLIESIIVCDTIISANGVFSGCNLLEYNTKNNINYIGSNDNPYLIAVCPTSKTLTSVVFDENCKVIEAEAFKNCTRLTNVVIPNNIVTIGLGAFNGCNSIESLEIPFVGDSRKTNSDEMQYPLGYIFGVDNYGGSTKTEQYYSTDSVWTTSTNYYIPTSLKKVTLHSEYVNYGAFYNCNNLTQVYISDNVISVDDRAFYGCTSLQYNVKDDIKYLGSIENPYIVAIDVTSKNVLTLNIDSRCKIILDGAFANCSQIKTVIIPNSVMTIGGGAFSQCSSLESITIGSGVKYIGYLAFHYCNKLTSATFYSCDGWKTRVGAKTILSEDLAKPENAAKMLIDSYLSHDWIRT